MGTWITGYAGNGLGTVRTMRFGRTS